MDAITSHEHAMRMIQVVGLPVHIFQNCRGLWQWEPLGTGEPWAGSEEYLSPEQAETAACHWGEDMEMDW